MVSGARFGGGGDTVRGVESLRTLVAEVEVWMMGGEALEILCYI